MRKRVMWLVVLGLSSVMLAAGWGDDSDNSENEPLSKQEYIAQGDEICARANQKIQKQAGKFFSALRENLDRGFGLHVVDPSPQQLQQFGKEAVIPNVKSEIDELRALPAPGGDEQTVARIYAAAQAGFDRLEKDPTLLRDENAVNEAFAEANKLAADYGFTDCD